MDLALPVLPSKMGPPPEPNREDHPFMGMLHYHGIPVLIENLPGTIRSGIDSEGEPWATTMLCHYGEIPGTHTVDGDPVDVFVGNDYSSMTAYVVQQYVDGAYDEDKVMLGFPSRVAAEQAYQAHYDKPMQYDVIEVPVADLKQQIITGQLQMGIPVSIEKAERIPGGRATGRSPQSFDPVMLDMGTRHEMEHTGDREVAMEIAMDHLAEDPDYYLKLQALEKAETYKVPEGARGNARKVLQWKEQHGDEVKGMTSVGWARARQLANNSTVSADTVKRMASFNRHRENATVDPKHKDEPWKDAGYVAWLGWGGDTGIDWAIRTSSSMDKATMDKHRPQLRERAREMAASEDPFVRQVGAAILSKAGPPGKGWEKIPKGKKGGYRKKTGQGYSYWYPDGKGVQGAAAKERPKAVLSAEQGREGRRVWVDHHPALPKLLHTHYNPTWKESDSLQTRMAGYRDERKQLHDKIVKEFVEKAPVVSDDVRLHAVVMMGGPSAGKSTSIEKIIGKLDDSHVNVNPDDVKKKLPEYKQAINMGHAKDGRPISAKDAAWMAHEESSDIAAQIHEEALASGRNILLDGTGKSLDKMKKRIQRLKDAGYHVHLLFVDIDKDEAFSRMKKRAEGSGRYVPDDVFDKAHDAIPANFAPLAELADEATITNNSGESAVQVYSKSAGKEAIHDQAKYEAYRQRAGASKAAPRGSQVRKSGAQGARSSGRSPEGAGRQAQGVGLQHGHRAARRGRLAGSDSVDVLSKADLLQEYAAVAEAAARAAADERGVSVLDDGEFSAEFDDLLSKAYAGIAHAAATSPGADLRQVALRHAVAYACSDE